MRSFYGCKFCLSGRRARGGKNKLAELEAWVHPDLEPDLTVLFDVSAQVGQQRVARIKAPDRFERESAEFFVRVRDAYFERMKESPHRFVRIDGTGTIPDIQRELTQKFTAVLAKWKA